MKLLVILLMLSSTSYAQFSLQPSIGVNQGGILTAGLGVGVSMSHVVGKVEFIAVGFSGQNEPALFGGRIGYRVWNLTPTIGTYFAYMSADRKTDNYTCMLYGLRYDWELVYLETNYAKQFIFLIGIKL